MKPVPLDWLVEMEKENRKDFNLQVQLIGSRGNVNGVHQLREEDKIALRVEVDRDAYIGIWTVDPEGQITQLYPSPGQAVPLVPAKTPHVIPGEKEDDIIVTAGGGLERAVVVASSQPWNLTSSEKAGPYLVFKKKEDRDKLRDTLRGLARAPKLSQQILPFVVGPKR